MKKVIIFLSESGQWQKHLVPACHKIANKRLKLSNCLHRVFCTTGGIIVLSFMMWLQLHSLQLKTGSNCLILNTVILFILKRCSDISCCYYFLMNTSLRYTISFEIKILHSTLLMIEISTLKAWSEYLLMIRLFNSN